MCGGYWVALANHARTRCSDGLLRPRCHVTYVEDATHQPTSVPANGLARAILVSRVTPEWGELGVLRIIEAWTPIGPGAPSGGFYRVRDTGVRCIRAPCFSYRAFRLNGRAPAIRVSSVEFGSVVRDSVVRGRAQAALGSGKGLLAAGRFGVSGDRGRVLQATQLYLEP